VANQSDQHLKSFQSVLSAKVKSYNEHQGTEQQFIDSQKIQVERLLTLEEEFRQELLVYPNGKSVYEAFIVYIRDGEKSILDARPFFRTRQGLFTQLVSPALKDRKPEAMYGCSFNYLFANFAVETLKPPKTDKLYILYKDLRGVRNKLIEVNTPLAIARSSQFYRRTKRNHLTRMDLIQIACEGLASGVDKFCGTYDNVRFRHMVIGRVLGAILKAYNETAIHFYPMDKRKIYNANKVINKCKPEDYQEIASRVNDLALEYNYSTTAEEITHLISASNMISSDFTLETPQHGGSQQVRTIQDTVQFADTNDKRPDVGYETRELSNKLSAAIGKLTLFEQKLLKLKGLEL